MPLRVLLDTNVLVSGLIGRAGPPRRLLDAWLDGRYSLVTSLYQVQELNHVLSYPHITARLALTAQEMELRSRLVGVRLGGSRPVSLPLRRASHRR